MNTSPMEIFSPTSGSDQSKYFKIENQVTITAVGLQPGDYMTFEAIHTSPTERDRICGCNIIPGDVGQVSGVIELRCPTCESDLPQLVRLTERNPVVILDAPQTGVLRAIYHGEGVAMHMVTAWVQESNTQDLTAEMRGCPPVCCEDEPQVWTDTSERRCFAGNYEMRELSNCGNYRWTIIEPLSWDDTGATRCVNGVPEKQQVDNCGNLQWVADADAVWVPTGVTRCNAGNVEAQELSECGYRWVITGAVTWTDTGVRRCTAGAPERQEVNECGDLRWVSDGAIVWVATGATRCNAGNVEKFEENQCGTTRWTIVGPVTWVADGTTRCNAGNFEAREVDNCGNLRWVILGPIVWTPTGLQECIGGFIAEQQENQCGQLRWTATATSCVPPAIVPPDIAPPPAPTDDCEIPANLYGVHDALLGAPEGWLTINGDVVPYYGIASTGCCEVTDTIGPAAAPATSKDCVLPMLTYGAEDALLARPLGFINFYGYLLPYYAVTICGALSPPVPIDTACVIPTGMIGRRDAVMGTPDGWADVGGYLVPFYAQQGCP